MYYIIRILANYLIINASKIHFRVCSRYTFMNYRRTHADTITYTLQTWEMVEIVFLATQVTLVFTKFERLISIHIFWVDFKFDKNYKCIYYVRVHDFQSFNLPGKKYIPLRFIHIYNCNNYRVHKIYHQNHRWLSLATPFF